MNSLLLIRKSMLLSRLPANPHMIGPRRGWTMDLPGRVARMGLARSGGAETQHLRRTGSGPYAVARIVARARVVQ